MKLRHTGTVVLLALFAVLTLAPLAHADTSDFTIDNFAADYTLGTDDRQGTLTIREQLTVEYRDYNHGILRAIPKRYNSMPLHLQVLGISRDGAIEKYSTYTSNGNLVLKIGNPDMTITGLHHYEINYKVANVMRVGSKDAELDWNVNGTQWQQQFLHVSATLHVPTKLVGKLTGNKCFTGVSGGKNSDCLVATDHGTTTFTTTRSLGAGETLTFNDHIPAGYFSKPTLADRWDDYGAQVITALLPPVLALLIVGSAWYRHGRDAKGRGTIVPEYSPPDDLKPAEIDVLLNNKLGKNAISATIIDLAIRGYLKIQEKQSDGILGLGKHKTYSFVRLVGPSQQDLRDYEAQVLTGLFEPSSSATAAQLKVMPNAQSGPLAKLLSSKLGNNSSSKPTEVGGEVEMSDLRNRFYTTVQAVQKLVPKTLTSQGYFSHNPTSAGALWLVLGLALIFGSFFAIQLGIVLFVGLLIAGLITCLFAALMPRRTPKGAAAKDAAEGLMLYMNTAEKDRIAMLQSPNAPYAPQSAEPVKTVDLFEKLLPYAMVLGVEQEWAKQFESIYTTPPDWYSGNWSTFNAVYLTSSLSDSMSAMNSSFAAPSSSGSGGSAGGGGGGGGGGGW